ncbi:MAG: phosphotransferase [Nannocystaceae bacterium]|nr:phosphotransferase [Nannocystaceae bacterium]
MFEADDMPAPVRAILPPVFSLVEPPQGELSDVAFVRSANQHDIVIKHSANPVYSQWLEREAKVLRALESTDLPVPQVIAHHVDGDAQWLLMTRIPGDSGWTTLAGASPAERRTLLRALGDMLARIHATKIPDALNDADATPWLERHRVDAQELSLEDDLLASFGPPPPEVRTFIHGDFTLDNVLLCDGRVCGVIDWSGCGAGDPRFDIALSLATSPELVLQPADHEAFFSGYIKDNMSRPLRTMVRDLYGVG